MHETEPIAAALSRSSRNPESFVRFYDEHFEGVLAYLARRVWDGEVAVDIAAESFAQAYVGRGRFRGSTNAEAAGWLYGIVRRQLARYFRKSETEARAVRRLGIELPKLDDDRRARVEELAELGELRVALRAELDRLPSTQRDALRLRVVEGLDYSEVARGLDVSEEAARARVARGVRSLAAAVDRNPTAKETAS